jgi:hypothetical protein
MKKIIVTLATVIVLAAIAFGIFMIGATHFSSTTVRTTSNLMPVGTEHVYTETTTWENVEVEDWD